MKNDLIFDFDILFFLKTLKKEVLNAPVVIFNNFNSLFRNDLQLN